MNDDEVALLKKLTAALEMIYDKWENGDPCFEDLETLSGSLGNAFKLSYEEENQILELIGNKGIALAAVANLEAKK